MAINPEALPGTIPAINIDTGVKLRVRPDMLELPHNALRLRQITEEEFLSKKSFVVKKLEVTTLESTDPEPGDSEGSDDIIMTSTNEPFKTDAAAKTAFKKKELTEEEWMILPVEGGFVITKI